MEVQHISAPTYQSQEEFDNKFGAEYESYGLHIKKVSIIILMIASCIFGRILTYIGKLVIIIIICY